RSADMIVDGFQRERDVVMQACLGDAFAGALHVFIIDVYAGDVKLLVTDQRRVVRERTGGADTDIEQVRAVGEARQHLRIPARRQWAEQRVVNQASDHGRRFPVGGKVFVWTMRDRIKAERKGTQCVPGQFIVSTGSADRSAPFSRRRRPWPFPRRGGFLPWSPRSRSPPRCRGRSRR